MLGGCLLKHAVFMTNILLEKPLEFLSKEHLLELAESLLCQQEHDKVLTSFLHLFITFEKLFFPEFLKHNLGHKEHYPL